MGKKGSRRSRRPAAGGIDPSRYFDSPSDPRAERKTRQLCREVRDALSGALGGLEDQVLVDAWIIEVIPAPDASHLRVIVAASPDADLDAVHGALGRASGVLRGEVASAITRKRTPLLSFQVVRETEP